MAVAGSIDIELKVVDGGYRATISDAGRVLRQFQSTAESTAKSVKRLEDSQFSLGTKFRNLVLTLGNLRFAAMDLYDVFLRLPAAILSTAGELERTQLLLEGLSKKLTDSGKALEGAADFKFVTRLAQQAPFALNALADSFVKLKTAGLDPLNGSMRALVDGVARFGGTDEQMKRASVAIQQMVGKGVVSMEELRQQLGEAVPTAMQDMADGMGMSMAKLTKAVSKGTVEATDAIQKMLGRMSVNNQGAAEKMMNSWVGMTSRFKTQLQLAAKEIADAGFFDEAKKALELGGDALNSREFKRFAVEMGDSMGRAVQAGISLVKMLYEVKDSIILAAQAFALYKIQSALIIPAIDAAKGAFKGLSAATKQLNLEKLNQASAARDVEVQNTRNLISELEKQQAAQQKAIDRKRIMISRMENEAEAAGNRMAALQKQLNAQPASSGSALTDPGFAQRANLQRQIDENARAYERQRNAITQTVREIDTANTTILRHGTAIEQAERNVRNLESAQMKLGLAARVSSGAMAVLGSAVNALGGPMGVILLLIQAGIAGWVMWGRKAEEAADRARRAMRGVSEAKDAQGSDDRIKELEADLAKSDAYLAEKRRRIAEGEKIDISKAEANNRDLRSKLEAERRNRSLIQENLDRQERSDFAGMIERRTEAQIKAIEDGYSKRINAEKQQTENAVKAAQGNRKKEDEARKAGVEREMKLGVEAAKAQVAGYQAAINTLRNAQKTAKGTELGGITDSIAALEEKKKDAEEKLKLRGSFGTPNRIVPKDDDKNYNNPIADLITRLKGDNANYQAQILGLQENNNALDKAAGAAAEIEANYRDGKFKYGEKDSKNATPQEVQRAMDLARENELLKQRAADGQKFVDFMNDLGPRYEDAVRMLANPLGEAADGRETKKFEKFLAQFEKNPKRLEEAAKAAGVAAEKFTGIGPGSARLEAAEIDFAPLYQKMVQETKQINDALVDDNREAAKKRKEVEDDVYRDFMQKQIDKLKAAGETEEKIAGIQALLSANVAARSADNAKKFASPMEKLVAEWSNTTRNMEEATARWANSTADAIGDMVMTGKADFGSLTKSILADILKIEIRARLGKSISGLIDSAGSLISSLLFADGGIMTSAGSVPLKKYAAGGIANSPQMAIFGEGDSPEAYVPLPDGRRIPVNLQGAQGAGNVVVNVINQTSQPVNASQGQPRFDGKQMVLDVVLTAASQPGPFRDGLRNVVQGMN